MLVDSLPLMLRGLAAMLTEHVDVDVVAQASDLTQVRALVQRVHPDVVVLDLMMPMQAGFDALAPLAHERPPPRVVILSMFDDIAYVRHALRMGAMAYVLKSATADELLEAVRCAARGEVYVGSGIGIDKLSSLPPDQQTAKIDSLQSLTAREGQILQLIADGFTNRQIADILMIGARTVETHRANVMRKLQLRNHTDLIRFALAHKLIAL